LPTNLAANKKAPMVVMIHGGPHYVRGYWTFDGEVQLLASRGYAVLQINYRGSGGYGDKFQQAGYLQWGGKMIQDIIDGTQYVINSYPIDENRMCLYGASYGGYAALMAAVRAPDTYNCTIGYVGIYDLNYAYTESDTMQAMGGEAYLNRVIGTNKEQLNEFSPVNHADKIKANVMLIHGEKDSRVPVINAETMLKKFESAGKKVPYLNFSNSGHGVYDEEGRNILYNGVLEFLDKNIGE
jgi:dipeptidyl aminopeptidase/acylaminoacyl peptidase